MQTTAVRCTYRTPSLTLTRISDGADKKNMIFSLLHDGEDGGNWRFPFRMPDVLCCRFSSPGRKRMKTLRMNY